MNEAYLRPRKTLDAFSRLYPEAWRQVDDLRAKRKELGNWPDWCFVPLAGADPTDRTRTRGSTTLVRTAPCADA